VLARSNSVGHFSGQVDRSRSVRIRLRPGLRRVGGVVEGCIKLVSTIADRAIWPHDLSMVSSSLLGQLRTSRRNLIGEAALRHRTHAIAVFGSVARREDSADCDIDFVAFERRR
jgi:hypothetical protein